MALAATIAVVAGGPPSAEAASSIERIKFVTVFHPPDGGTPIRRETPGPDRGAGLTRLDVDSDPEDELTVSTGLSFDASELAVTGKLHISRLDFGGILSPSTLPPLPVRVEAVAVLKDTKNGETKRKHVSLGYDALGEEGQQSTAPGKFTLDVGSCVTPDCKSTPTTCRAPCEGRKTTLAMGVVAPGRSLKLTGELSDYATGGGREDATRATLDLEPVPGSSSPLVLTIWSTETRTSNDPGAPVPTLHHMSMTGNKEATKATAHVCRLPDETYEPKRIADTACDAAGDADEQIDSRRLTATLDPLPRDVGAGNARVAVSIADNDRGARGGVQKVAYEASELVDVRVTDRAVAWRDGERHEGDRTYDLVDVPTRASLELLDESDSAGTDDPVKSLQTITYDADGEMRSVDVDSVERIDGTLVKREDLRLERLPTHLEVVAKESEVSRVLPGLLAFGFDRRSRQEVGLVETSGPIGVIEYSTADGETTASPPDDIGDAYVYVNKRRGGPRFVALRLLEAGRGTFEIGRFERRDPWNVPWKPRPQEESGMDLLSVTGTLKPTAFRTLAEDGRRVFDVRVDDLPGRLDLTLEPQKGLIDYEGSAPIGRISVEADDPDGLFERATSLDVVLTGVPTGVAVQYPSETDGDLDLDVDGGTIGRLDLIALGDGDPVPGEVRDDAFDGLVLRDLEGIEDVDDSYVLFARARGVRHVSYRKAEVDANAETQQRIDRKQFALDLTSGRDFVVDIEQTGDVKEHTWHQGYDWSDEDSRCSTEVVGKRRERIRAVIARLAPGTELGYDKRRSFGKRECFENARVGYGPFPLRYPKEEVKDIRYTAGASVPRLDFELADGSTNLDAVLRTLPTRLRFCKADRFECLPTVHEHRGHTESSLGSLVLDANDYFTVDLVDCEEELEDRECGSPKTRISDLRLKQFEFWGDLDGRIDGTSGDTYWNTADYDYELPTWNGVPWDHGPYTGLDQPFQDAGRDRPARIRGDSFDFRFGPGFYVRGAHIYWQYIADDEVGDWSPDGTGGEVHCPEGTYWEVDAGTWVEVHEDWCTSGAAAD